jgi:hypothetical protein
MNYLILEYIFWQYKSQVDNSNTNTCYSNTTVILYIFSVLQKSYQCIDLPYRSYSAQFPDFMVPSIHPICNNDPYANPPHSTPQS